MLDPRRLAAADQTQAAARAWARVVSTYYCELLTMGIDRSDALELALHFQGCVLSESLTFGDEE